LAYLYIDGYSEKDIAEMLDISISNVGVKIHRLKQKLKKIHETK
jgi:DNA-directed RNA polymerase specialized sigma24 family protein